MTSRQDLSTLPILLDGCQICERIGGSFLGTLYRVVHPELGDCALKYFRKSVLKIPGFSQKFLYPLQRLTGVAHTSIARIHQIESEENPFLLRELVLGSSLQDELKIKKTFSAIEATQITAEAAIGLLAGHSLGILSKNLKLSNVILLPNGRVRLVDISLPPTHLGHVAPEQWEQKGSSPASDIYALGGIYFQLLSGKLLPISEKSTSETFQTEQFRPEIAAILHKMTALPDERYQSTVPLLKDLQNILEAMGADVQKLKNSLQTVISGLSGQSKVQDKGPESPSGGPATAMVAFKHKESVAEEGDFDGLNTTRKMCQDEYTELEVEEIHLSRESLQQEPEKALEMVSYIDRTREEQGHLHSRLVHFPREFEEKVIGHLQKCFRRETWLLKESDTAGEMELEIDLDQSCVLKHFYLYDDLLQKSLQDMEEVGDPRALPDQNTDFENTARGLSHTDFENTARGLSHTDFENTARVSTDTDNQATVNFSYEKECDLPPEDHESSAPEDFMETVVFTKEEKATLQEEAPPTDSSEGDMGEALCLDDSFHLAGKDITVVGRPATTRRFRCQQVEMSVNSDNSYQNRGWAKFVQEYGLKRGEHFAPHPVPDDSSVKKFVVYLEKLERYQKEQENIARIKEFFEGDYEIIELNRGGMGMVLKLTAKNDPTILSLRPENYWARQRFASYLRVLKDSKGQEICYAEIPQGTEFVVKVAFEGFEESLVQEAGILSRVAEDPNVCQTIIGAVQQGRLFALNDKEDQTQIGYYMMLEYAAQGDTEKLYTLFPDGKLSPTIAFSIIYGMVQTLQKLEQKGIIHRDLKPHNILLDHNGLPKLSDFGLAITTTRETGKLTSERKRLLRMMDQEFMHISLTLEQTREKLAKLESMDAEEDQVQQIAALQEQVAVLQKQEQQRADIFKGKYRLRTAQESARKKEFAGSLYYAAPEQLNPEAVLSPRCDLYQLGAVMFTLLTGKRPVYGATSMEIVSRVLYPEKPKVSDFVRGKPIVDALSEVIHQMMQHDPEKRMVAREVRERLDRILFEHALELKELPEYTPPEDLHGEELKKWESRVEFAHDLHKKCVELIFSTIFKNQDMPTLSKDVQKIVFNCPHCAKKLHLYPYMNGKRGTCPGCRQKMVVRLEEP